MSVHGTSASSPHPPLDSPSDQAGPAALRVGTFRSLRHRNFRLYFFGQLVSLTGSWVQTTALTWLAYGLTDENKWSARVVAAQLLPTFFFGPWTGALADRWPRRSVLLLTQTALLGLAVLLGGLALGGRVSPYTLLGLAIASGLINAVDFPVRLSFVTDLVVSEDVTNAVALNSLSFNIARLIGPAIAGVLLQLGTAVAGFTGVTGPDLLLRWGAGLCFLVNGLSYLAVLGALARMDIVRPSGAARVRARPSALAGFHHLAGRPRLAVLILMAGIITLCGWPFMTLLPDLAKRVLHVQESGYSLMISATGVGALAASLMVATYVAPAARAPLIGSGVGLVCLSLTGLSLATNLYWAAACCALIGLGMILFLATGQSMVQLSAPDHDRGPVLGIWAMVVSGAIPAGTLLSGWVADAWGVPTALRWQGGTCAVAALAFVILMGLRRRKDEG